MKNIDASLSVFFTGGMSLDEWSKIGIIDRELELYRRLYEHLGSVNIFSYGGQADIRFKESFQPLNIVPVPWRFNSFFTKFEMYLKYKKTFKNSDVFKTNQIIGSEIPVWLKSKFHKKLIVRCGYLHSDFAKSSGVSALAIARAVRLERDAFTQSDAGVVTSDWQKELIVKEYHLIPEKIHVIPNFVMTDLFCPLIREKKFDIVYVGRSNYQKNLFALLEAIQILKNKKLRYTMLMIGGCSKDKKIRSIALTYNLDITFMDNVSNFKLPALLNSARVYILPSFHEGHPKTLLEAMSCGLPCIGTDVPGIKEDISHEETGYLCGTSPEDLATAIQIVMTDELLQKKMGDNARKYILNRYSLDTVIQKEMSVIEQVLEE